MSTSLPRARYSLPDPVNASGHSGASRSPRLDKLKPSPLRSPPLALDSPHKINRSPTRLKDLREQALVRKCEAALLAEWNQQEQQRSFQFHTRWVHLRDLYALMCEAMLANASRRKLSPVTSLLSPSRVSTPSTPTTVSGAQAQSPAASSAPAAWLRDVASELHRVCPVPEITLAQLEIAVNKALHVEVFSAPAFVEAAVRLKTAFSAFQRSETLKTDFRELLCALSVLDRRRAGGRKLLELWFEEFATVPLGFKTLAIAKHDVRRMLFTACEGVADEKRLEPFATELCEASSGVYVSERAFSAYVGEVSSVWFLG